MVSRAVAQFGFEPFEIVAGAQDHHQRALRAVALFTGGDSAFANNEPRSTFHDDVPLILRTHSGGRRAVLRVEAARTSPALALRVLQNCGEAAS